jgi:hypothetical protein
MPIEELIAYVVLLSLPLWLLVEQLLHIRAARRSDAPQPLPQPEPRPEAQPARRPERRVPAPPLPGALRSGQR